MDDIAQLKEPVFENPHFRSSDTCRMVIRYNKKLDRCANPILLNEDLIADLLRELEGIVKDPGTLRWLTLSRLSELTLFSAANYASNGCVQAMGDLFFNPRKIHVHIRGKARPVIKKRHSPLTEQFRDKALNRGGVVQWLKTNTMVEVVEKPILPHLMDLIGQSGTYDDYLDAVKEKMASIAHHAVCGPEPGNLLSHELYCFYRLGKEIRNLAMDRLRFHAA